MVKVHSTQKEETYRTSHPYTNLSSGSPERTFFPTTNPHTNLRRTHPSLTLVVIPCVFSHCTLSVDTTSAESSIQWVLSTNGPRSVSDPTPSFLDTDLMTTTPNRPDIPYSKVRLLARHLSEVRHGVSTCEPTTGYLRTFLSSLRSWWLFLQIWSRSTSVCGGDEGGS